MKPVGTEPSCRGLNIRIGRSEPCTELLGCQPLVVAGRLTVVGVLQELLERELPLLWAVQQEEQPIRLKRIGDGAEIVAGLSKWVYAAVQRELPGFVDWPCNKSSSLYLAECGKR